MFHKIHLQTSPKRSKFIAEPSRPASRCNSPNSIHWRLVCAIHPSIHLQHELGRTNRKKAVESKRKIKPGDQRIGSWKETHGSHSWNVAGPYCIPMAVKASKTHAVSDGHCLFSCNIHGFKKHWKVVRPRPLAGTFPSLPSKPLQQPMARCTGRQSQPQVQPAEQADNSKPPWKLDEKTTLMVDVHKSKWVTQYECEIIQGCTLREAGRTGRGRGVSNAKRARTNTPTDGRSAR